MEYEIFNKIAKIILISTVTLLRIFLNKLLTMFGIILWLVEYQIVTMTDTVVTIDDIQRMSCSTNFSAATTSLTSAVVTMGNSLTSATRAAANSSLATTDGGDVTPTSTAFAFGGSIRSRRGSRVKVFGLLGQKKPPKEQTTPTTPKTVGAASLFGVTNVANTSTGCAEIIDEEEAATTIAALHRKHDVVVHQLESEQMEIRRKHTSQKKKKKFNFFGKQTSDTPNEKFKLQTVRVPVHKKCQAPNKPPATSKTDTTPIITVKENKLADSKTTVDEYIPTSSTRLTTHSINSTKLLRQHNDTENEQDHCENLEKLIDSNTTQKCLEEFGAKEGEEENKQNDNAINKPVLTILKRDEELKTKQTTTTTRTVARREKITIPLESLKSKTQHLKESTNVSSSCTIHPIASGSRKTSSAVDSFKFKRNMGSDEPSDQLLESPPAQQEINVMHERHDSILRDTFCDNDFDDDYFQNCRMASSLTASMMMMGGSAAGRRRDCSFNNDSCDNVVLRDLSSSSDSLFTDPLTPPQSSCETAPVGSLAEPCTTTDNDDNDDDDDDDDDDDNEHECKNQKHFGTTSYKPAAAAESGQLPTSLKELTAFTVAATPTEKSQRPLSDISITSGDTSGILSPTIAKAILELQKRHQADKLSLLSVAKTTYLELLPIHVAAPSESSPELETESTDEQMALHLGKKLAQVLSGNGSAGNTNANIAGSVGVGGVNTSGAGTAGSPMSDNMNCCSLVSGTNELFNIAKAKKIELPSLSSRLVATAAQSQEEKHTIATASANARHLTTLQSPSLPSSTGASATTSTASTETQSTVIISFKSSQTPVQSQPPLAIAEAEQQPECSAVLATPLNNADDTITESVAPSLSTITSHSISTTAQMGSPVCTPRTPKNNVLKKVASFTLEKSSAGSANSKINNGDPNSGMLGQLENIGSKRLSFVPEKLSFAAYEKFEGQMLMKWFLASLQNNCSHLSEQDISTLTLQYCNNLINVGVLKQISEKNDLETFKPFQMYQWTHTEAPTTSQPHTPGKLDKVSAWPYCSTPTGVTRLPKAIQVDSPQPERDNGFLPMLRKRILSCSDIVEVHGVVNEMLSGGEPLRRPSKRCMQLTDLSSASETTVYQYDRNTTETSSGCESGVQEAAVQTEEVSLAMQEFVCCKCNSLEERPHEILMCEVGIQVSFDEEIVEKELNESKPPIPPPPPMSGMAAPPPPPPPPPMPLSSLNFAPPPPPPPPSVSPLPPPPPPPPNGAGPPPPPPAPPGDSSQTSSPLRLNTSTVPPPPPPGAPKTPSSATPAPLPNPAEGGWFNQANTLRKTAVNPPKPMKPLYWTRIVTHPAPPKPQPIAPVEMSSGDATDSSSPSNSPEEPSLTPKEIWQEIDETNLDNIDEFTELFSREAVVPKVVPKIKAEVRVKTMKVLDSKRSQNVGIISRSSHVDFFEIEHAIYHVDTSVVSLETLQQIINIKATNDELELIKEAAQGDIPLDYPEKFLLKISQISMSTERISCIVFMADFEEAATVIERKLEVVMQLSQFLVENEELKLIFAIILTLGNYMNGGNRQRGQADGFTLEILSKLKDVKSKESQTTLLHFIVRTYISRKRKEGVQLLEIPLPIPEPSDVERATQVDFDEVKRQINDLSRQLKSSKDITERVIINSTEQNLEPFKSKMEEFIGHASKAVDKIYKELDDCRDVFIETMKFYHFQPKTGTLDQCTPKKFYEHWTNFTNDFKDIMKKEIAILWNELLKKSKDAAKRNKTVKTTKVKPGGLKERIMRLNKK